MMMKPVSEALMELLVRQGMARGRAGTRTVRGKTNASSLEALSVMGEANALLDMDLPAAMACMAKGAPTEAGASFTGRRQNRAGGNLSELQPSLGDEAQPVLKLIVSNKCLPRATPMQGLQKALGRHLVLVWSR